MKKKCNSEVRDTNLCRVDIRQMPPQHNPVKSQVWQASQEKHKFLRETYQDENSIYPEKGAFQGSGHQITWERALDQKADDSQSVVFCWTSHLTIISPPRSYL